MAAIAVIGAGNSGLAMAAHLTRAGESVRLWNRSWEQGLLPLVRNGGIEVKGVFEGKYLPELVTDTLPEAVAGAGLILVTVPADAHLDVVASLAPYLTDGQIVLLNPGRTFGALLCHRYLRRASRADVTVAESQTIVYTCRKSSDCTVTLIAYKRRVPVAALDPRRTPEVLRALPVCLRLLFKAAPNTLHTSLGNVGMILHCAPMLFNVGWLESKRTRFKYYYEGITPSVASFLELLDAERIAAAGDLGVTVASTAEWMRHVYGVKGNSLYECIQANESYARIDAPVTLRHRYLLEDVPCGLVPLEALGSALGRPMRLTKTVIDLACQMLSCDFRLVGRSSRRLGLRANMAREDLTTTLLPPSPDPPPARTGGFP